MLNTFSSFYTGAPLKTSKIMQKKLLACRHCFNFAANDSSFKSNISVFPLIDANSKTSLVITNTAYNELIHVNIMARCKQYQL